MTAIRAVDEITVQFTPQQVWEVLTALDAYPRWWPRYLGLKLLEQKDHLIGSALQIRPFGGRAFQCRVAELEPDRKILMEYFGNFICGTGKWRIEPVHHGTRVVYELDVEAKGVLVAVLGKVLPLGKIHSKQMADVLKRLAKELETRFPVSQP